MRKIFVLTILIICIERLYAQGTTIQAFSLQQAVDFAIKNNTTAKNAKLSETEAKWRNKEILSIGLPQINANFDYTYNIIKPLSPAINKIFNDPNSLTNQVYKELAKEGKVDASGNFVLTNPNLGNIIGSYSAAHKDDKIYFTLNHAISTGIALNQLVFDARYFIGIKATKALSKTAALGTQLSEQDIRYTITKGYYETQAAKEIKRYLEANLEIVVKLLHDTRETYKVGLIEELDVNRLELAEATLKSQINNTQNLYELSLASFKYNMGMQMTDPIALTDNIEELRKKTSITANNSFDPNQRIETELLQTAITLKGYDVKQKAAGYSPAMYAFLSYGGGSQVDNFGDFFTRQTNSDGQGGYTHASNWFQQSFVGFTLKLPIYDGGLKQATVKQAKIEVEKSKNDLENFKNASALQVQAANTTFGANLIEEENAKLSMTLNEKIFNKTKIKFNEGIGSSFELIQTESDLSTNQIRYINAIKNVLTSRADLDKALGKK